MAATTSLPEKIGRTLVLAFDGTANQFGDKVSYLPCYHVKDTDPPSNSDRIPTWSSSVLPWFVYLPSNRMGIGFHLSPAQKLDDPDKQIVFYQVRPLR